MKLNQLTIKNYRCFENLTVNLHPELTVIVGANGAGKSSLLEAITFGCFPFSIKTVQYPSSNNLVGLHRVGLTAFPNQDDFIISNENLSTSSIEILIKTTPFEDLPEYANRFFCTALPMGQILATTESEQLNLTDEPIFFVASSILLPVLYRTSRNLSQNIRLSNDDFSRFNNPDLAFENGFNASSSYGDMLSWFYLRETQELRDSREQDNGEWVEYNDMNALRSAIKETLEDVEKVFFKGTPPVCYVKFRDPNDGIKKSIRLEQVSDGYRNFLAIVMDYARRLSLHNPTMENPLEAPGILMIDEIELHLHPKWQQRVLLDLRRVFPNSQIIVTTHSAAVLSTVRRENIIVLDENHQIRTLPEDFGSYGAESSKLLAQVFGVNDRPEIPEVNERISRYRALVETEQHNNPEGQRLRAELVASLGEDDLIIMSTDLRIKQIAYFKGKKNAQN